MDASRICKRSPMVQGKSSVLTSRVMEVSPFSVWALRRATRSYFWALMVVRVKVSEKRLASPMVVRCVGGRGGMVVGLGRFSVPRRVRLAILETVSRAKTRSRNGFIRARSRVLYGKGRFWMKYYTTLVT